MTRFLRLAVAAVALLLAVPAPGAFAQNVPNYTAQGGAVTVIGGSIDVVTGGALKIAGVDKTAAVAAAVTQPVQGVASGYLVARGETALDGSNPTPITTGLTTITGCSATIKSTSAPGVGTSAVTYGTSSGTLNLYGWKVTGSGDATLIASTGTETVGWVCVGT